MWRDKQPHGYSRPILRRSYFDLVSGYSRPILGRSYFDLISGYSRPIIFPCVTAGKINYGCLEMLSWPHRTSNNILNICFWLLETCTKCSYIIHENVRPGAQRLAFEVKFEYIAHRSTNIPWAGGLRLGKLPDNRRLMCWPEREMKHYHRHLKAIHPTFLPF